MTDTLPAPDGEAPQRTPRVLLAEDDHATANVLQTLLQRSGYEVTVARDGAEALRLLADGPSPDVLLLDWMLPEISGVDICRQVRKRWDELTLPVLMVTAKTDAESISAAFAAGASDYLTKPFLAAELRARIAAHLRVKQMVDEQNRMTEQLQEREKLSALGMLVSGVAHDLNNPLASIAGFTQLLLEDETDADKVSSLRLILSEVQRCNRIVTDLLAFARRRPVERQRVEVGELLRGCVALRERSLQAAGVRVQLEVEPDLPRVWGGEHQLQQVFLNIIINAEQALRHRGERLRIRARAISPFSPPDPVEEWLEVEFCNDGPPIPAEVLPHVFEPFFTTKGPDEGTGLGLAICKRIVGEHGGDIEVSSDDRGTTFRIRLPGADAVGG